MNRWTFRGPDRPSLQRIASEDERVEHSWSGIAFLAADSE